MYATETPAGEAAVAVHLKSPFLERFFRPSQSSERITPILDTPKRRRNGKGRVGDDTIETNRKNLDSYTIEETYKVGALSHDRDTQELLKETDVERLPVTWPETTLNPGRAVDEFLWKGDSKATPIQRAGLVIYASVFLLPFAVFVVLTLIEHDWLIRLIELIMATLTGIAGLRLLLNAFRHQKHPKVDR